MIKNTPVASTATKPVSKRKSEEVTEVASSETSDVKGNLEKMLRIFEDDKRRAVENIATVRSTMKLLVAEKKGTKKVKRERDPSKPVAKNGIAKPQKISTELSDFLNKHYGVEKGSLVSRTGALSKENGISRYITDKNLRKDGEIHPDGELKKLLGEPQDLSKDGKSKVYYHKSLMKLIGRHFPKKAE